MARGRFDNLIADVALIRKAFRVQADARTLAGNVTLVDEDYVVYAADAGGSSRNVTLPARTEAANGGVVRWILNLSTAGETLSVKNSAGTTILTIPSGCAGMLIASSAVEDPTSLVWQPFMLGGQASATITNTSGTLGNTNSAVSSIITALQAHGIIL